MQLPPNSLQIVQQAQQATAAVGSSANYGYAPQGGGGQQYPNQNAVYGGGYGQQQPAYASGTSNDAYASSGAAVSTTVPTDPTAYYKDFWQYVAYYGEPAARAYYQQWSPPVGSTPPAPDSGAPTTASESNADFSSTAKPDETSSSDGGGGTDAVSHVTDTKNESSVDNVAVTASTTSGTDEAWEAYKKQVCYSIMPVYCISSHLFFPPRIYHTYAHSYMMYYVL